MILCVTLNPCLDRTLEVNPWSPGEIVRGGTLSEVAGGKGNNVARALARLGRAAVPATFLGGSVGMRCEELLREIDGLEPLRVRTAAPTREILTVRTRGTADQTAFFDPDPAIREAEAAELARQVGVLLDSGAVRALALSGSSPAPSTHATFQHVSEHACARGVPVFVDTYGPALLAIRDPWPSVIKINRREAATVAPGRDPLDLLDGWARAGVALAAVTDGPGPVLAQHRGTRYRVIPPAIEAVNPIGSGDCLLAGLVDGWLAGLPAGDLLRYSVAAAVANALVWDAGAIDRPAIERLVDQVRLETLP